MPRRTPMPPARWGAGAGVGATLAIGVGSGLGAAGVGATAAAAGLLLEVGNVAISAPRSSDLDGGVSAPAVPVPGSGAGVVAVGPLGGVPAAPSRPYSPELGSGAWRGSGSLPASRLARSTKGTGALVT